MGLAESSLGLAGVVALAWGATRTLPDVWTIVVLIIGIVLIVIALALVIGRLWMCERNHARYHAAYKTCSSTMGAAAQALVTPVVPTLWASTDVPMAVAPAVTMAPAAPMVSATASTAEEIPPPPPEDPNAPIAPNAPPMGGRFYFPGAQQQRAARPTQPVRYTAVAQSVKYATPSYLQKRRDGGRNEDLDVSSHSLSSGLGTDVLNLVY